MAAVQSLAAALSSSSGIAGTPCQFSSRSRAQTEGRRRRTGSERGRKVRARAQAAPEEAGAGRDGGTDDEFEARIARLQKKVTSGSGKKAELRKARKEGGGDPYAPAAASKSKKESVFIPPVALQEPASDGMVVQFGLSPYTERLHGRLAALGLAAVLLVELATGESLVKFHDSETLFVQVYAVLGLAVLFVKLEKEKISVWPKG